MSYIKYQTETLKHAIDNGIVSKDSPLILEQKEKIIDILSVTCEANGFVISKSQIGNYVDKLFSDLLGVD